MVVNDRKMLSDLTVADLKDIIGDLQLPKNEEVAKPVGRLVYGLKGIEQLFGVSHRTAQFLKDHVIQEAVSQHGRKIVVNADLALKLFAERGRK